MPSLITVTADVTAAATGTLTNAAFVSPDPTETLVETSPEAGNDDGRSGDRCQQ